MIKKFFLGTIACLLSLNAFAMNNEPKPAPLKGTVALTFDDGTTEKYTPQILDILKKYNIKATFFMVGMNAKAHPDMVKRVLEEGHAIGNHSQTHPNLTKLSNEALYKEIVTPKSIIHSIVGINPLCLRYPYGASNEHVRTVIRENDMIPMPMGFNSFDYDRPGTEKIVDWVLKNAYSGQIFLFHDGFDKREQTVAALPQIIEGLKKKGLGFSQICMNKQNNS